ncbi:MAG TPA: hypothetical protein VK028_12665 [Micromonosporaceae bacterium]|nr:hypothetical protein [Micromonosporaceae bacterium]
MTMEDRGVNRTSAGDPGEDRPATQEPTEVRPAEVRATEVRPAEMEASTDVLASPREAPEPIDPARRADWGNFAPQPVPPPPRPGRIRRLLGHEWTLATLAAVAISALVNRRVLMHPTDTLPQDVGDPSLVAYLIAWTGHALLNDPANLWHTNAFFPAQYGLAFSDSLLGYAPFGMIGSGVTAAILRYNIIFVSAFALVLLGGYALARQLGLGRTPAAVTAAAIAFAPWRLAHGGHLQVLSMGGILLALAMLARGHGVRFRRAGGSGASAGGSQRRSAGWALAGWLVAAWQISLGFGIGLPFAYVLLAVFVVGGLGWAIRWRPGNSRWPPLRLLVADGAGGLIFTGVSVLMAQPYLRVLELYPYARRDASWVDIYSPPPDGLLIAPAESVFWGDLHETARAELSVPGEMTLLPGFALLAFAAAGLFFSVWAIWVRLALLAGAAVTALLALGTNGPGDGRFGYLLLLNLPGFEGIRTPGRLILWTTTCLALLAGGAVGALVSRAHAVAQYRGLPQPTTAAQLALLIPLALIVIEGTGDTPQSPVPRPPAALASVAAPYLVLPSDTRDVLVMLWSADRFAPTVNGQSGVDPAELQRIRQEVQTFPDAASVDFLRTVGVRTVVVPTDRAAGTPWEQAATTSIAGLDLRRDVQDDAVIFHLDP